MRIENSAFRVLSITGARSSSMLESCTRYVEQNRSLDGTAMTSPACLSCYGTAGTSDGTVQLGETVMTAPNDLVTHDASHSYLPQDPEVAALVIHFLQHGRFPPHAQRPSA